MIPESGDRLSERIMPDRGVLMRRKDEAADGPA
jgi:hypothetical protein